MNNYPEIGTQLYLQQETGNYYVDMVKWPYTVIDVRNGKVIIQSAKLNFPTPSYYDTLPDSIEEDKEGDILELTYSRKKKMWQIDRYKTGYPSYAYFGKWEYTPYLN